ncbi:MAG TPA: tellurite resistance TerB family protein [Sedimenticola sp.]|nr:tellurite resistance TerB family protein [Sedimenticola sp.]
MAGLSDLVGILMQGGLSQSGNTRVGTAMGPQGMGQSGGLMDQVIGGSGSGGLLGGLMDAAKGMMSGQSQGQGGGIANNPLAAGGLGALAGALFGGGGDSVKGALGGGAMAMLAGLAFQAFKNMNRQPAAFTANEPPLGVRPPASPQEEQELEATASVILKGMINAAKADGNIDSEEIRKILGRLQEAGADAAVQQMVMEEMQGPMDLDGLVQEIPNEAVAAQVYLASLFAIEVDTDEERAYLQQLAQRTGLDSGVVQQLQQMVGVH